MAKRRNFTPEFKAEVVLEALNGQSSQAELCRKHNLSDVQRSNLLLIQDMVIGVPPSCYCVRDTLLVSDALHD